MINFSLRFRTIAFIGIAIMVLGIVHARFNSKEKNEYDRIDGHITHLGEKLGALPNRDVGIYRYLVIDTYPFPFEIYADEQGKRIDSLKAGDMVTVFFYETGNTKSESLNRFLQYLEKDGGVYFVRGDFQKKLGFVVSGLGLMLILFVFILYKKNKIAY